MTNNVNNQSIENYIQTQLSNILNNGYITQNDLNNALATTISSLQNFVITTIDNDTITLTQLQHPSTGSYTLSSINGSPQWRALSSSDISDLSTTLLPYAIINNVYGKSYIDTLISGYYNKSYIDTLISAYYNKTYIDSLIANYALANSVYTQSQSDSRYLQSTSLTPYSTTTQMNTAITIALSPYQLISGMSSYLQSSALTPYSTTTQMNTAITNSLSPYSTTTQMNTTITNALIPYQLISGMSSYLQSSALTPYSTTTQMNSAISSALSPYYTQNQSDNRYIPQTRTKQNNELYVSSQYGSDSTGNGSIYYPYATIAQAIANVDSNTNIYYTIYIAVGTYSETALTLGSRSYLYFVGNFGISDSYGVNITNPIAILGTPNRIMFKNISFNGNVNIYGGNNIKFDSCVFNANIYIGDITYIVAKDISVIGSINSYANSTISGSQVLIYGNLNLAGGLALTHTGHTWNISGGSGAICGYVNHSNSSLILRGLSILTSQTNGIDSTAAYPNVFSIQNINCLQSDLGTIKKINKTGNSILYIDGINTYNSSSVFTTLANFSIPNIQTTQIKPNSTNAYMKTKNSSVIWEAIQVADIPSNLNLNTYNSVKFDVLNLTYGSTNNVLIMVDSLSNGSPTPQWTALNTSYISNLSSYSINSLANTLNLNKIAIGSTNKTVLAWVSSALAYTALDSTYISDFSTQTNTLIVSATINPNKLSGYPSDSTKYLCGDGTWATVNGSSSLPTSSANQILTTNSSNTITWASTIGTSQIANLNTSIDNRINTNVLFGSSSYGSVLVYNGGLASTSYAYVAPSTLTSFQVLAGRSNTALSFRSLSLDTSDIGSFSNFFTGTQRSIYDSFNSTGTSISSSLYFTSIGNNLPAICGVNPSGLPPSHTSTRILSGSDRAYLAFYNYYTYINGNSAGVINYFTYGGTSMSYISSSGSLISLSSDTMKTNIRKKNPHDQSKQYLNRILQTNIYSYSYINDTCTQNVVNVGVLRSEVINQFNENGLGYRKKISNSTYNCGNSECKLCNSDIESDQHVNHNEIFYYHILAFQAYVKQTDDKISYLETKNTDLQYQLNVAQNAITNLTNLINGMQSTINSLSSRMNVADDKLTRLMG